MDHLDIHHDERLLAAARKHVSELQVKPSGVRSQAQKSILQSWRQPSWEKHKTYNKTTGKVYFSEKTIDEVKAKGPSRLQRQQKAIAGKLKLDKFDPNLGNVGSPQHGDHLLVWAHYLQFFAGPNNIARGLTAGANRWISQRIIHQFLRLRPLYHESGPDSDMITSMRLTVMKVLALPGRYRSLVTNYNIPIADTPSWSAAMIPEDHTKVGAVRSLAMTGFTCDEADDVYPYASSFLTELASDPWATPGAQGFAQGALHSGRQITPANPWPEVLMFVYNERHRRWLPVVHPASDTGRLQVASSQMSSGSGGSIIRGLDWWGRPETRLHGATDRRLYYVFGQCSCRRATTPFAPQTRAW